MDLRTELLIGKPLDEGQELLLSVLLSREWAARLLDERLFRPEGITDQQYNVLRILQGGPDCGYLIGEIRRRMLVRSADVPRLVDRLAARSLVERAPDPRDRRGCLVRITEAGKALEARIAAPRARLCGELERLFTHEERQQLLRLLETFRDGARKMVDGKEKS